MSDQELMTGIKAQQGALLRATAATHSIPESFFAALVANESGGDPDAKRFEKAVFGDLAEVLLGRKAAYGSLGGADIRAFVLPPGAGFDPPLIYPAQCIAVVEKLESLATSWGLVQIMGYEALPFHLSGPAALQDPQAEMRVMLQMFNQFIYHNGLDATKDFPQLFDCWNTGRAHAPTADPQYIPRGLNRKAIYEALP